MLMKHVCKKYYKRCRDQKILKKFKVITSLVYVKPYGKIKLQYICSVEP